MPRQGGSLPEKQYTPLSGAPNAPRAIRQTSRIASAEGGLPCLVQAGRGVESKRHPACWETHFWGYPPIALTQRVDQGVERLVLRLPGRPPWWRRAAPGRSFPAPGGERSGDVARDEVFRETAVNEPVHNHGRLVPNLPEAGRKPRVALWMPEPGPRPRAGAVAEMAP